MIDLGLFALYLVAAAAMILSPGPDTIYVLTRSLGEGRRVGVASAAGISTGVVVHTLAAILGLAALFQASGIAFSAVTTLGAAYLGYLGLRTIHDDGLAVDSIESDPSKRSTPSTADDPPKRRAPSVADDQSKRDAPSIAAGSGSNRPDAADPFREAVTVNVLNPQVALFFLAFLPQFVSGAWIELQLTLLGGTYAALTMLYLTSVAVAASALRRLLVTRPIVADAIRWASGLVLLGLGFRLLLFGP